MENKRFTALLGLIVPQVIEMIVQNDGGDEAAAANAFYRSKVYASMEDEATGVWHFSPLTLYMMYDEEKRTGAITFPEEG